MNTHWIDRLSEYHDGELSPAEHAACDAHVAECEMCRSVLRELQLVTIAARADVDRDPVTDLWPQILSKIASAKAGARIKPFRVGSSQPLEGPLMKDRALARSSRRQVTFSLPQLALAASLLIAVSASVSYLAMSRSTTTPLSPREAPIQAMAEPLMPPSAEVTPANFADAQFDKAVADLEQILVEQRDTLDPRTVMVIERNLAVIDEAIRQARAALQIDPANTFLNSHLADARRRKLDLLRRATALSGAGLRRRASRAGGAGRQGAGREREGDADMIRIWYYGTLVALALAATPALGQEHLVAETQQPPIQARPGGPEGAQRTDQTLDVTKGTRLVLTNNAGEVTVRSWERDQVRVQASHSERERVDIQTADSTLRIRGRATRGPANLIDYQVTVPRWMAVNLSGTYLESTIEGTTAEVTVETVHGNVRVVGGSGVINVRSVEGTINVEKASGKVQATTVNEGIRLSNVTGDMTAETTNGDIVIENAQTASLEASTVNGDVTFNGTMRDSGSYRLTTHGGDIRVGLGGAANATVFVRTFQGDFEADFPIQLPEGQTARSGSKRFNFTLGSGSARIELQSFNGDIRLARKTILTQEEARRIRRGQSPQPPQPPQPAPAPKPPKPPKVAWANPVFDFDFDQSFDLDLDLDLDMDLDLDLQDAFDFDFHDPRPMPTPPAPPAPRAPRPPI